jgi:OmcA/MtrC family decaheme c-type cytochrome
LTGPNDDYAINIRENAIGKVTPAGADWVYTFTAPVPANAGGSWSVGAEGRITVTLDGASVRDSMENRVVPVAVTDSEPEARRLIVDDAKCESCHSNLSLHGDNRKNANVYCQTCHKPDATDAVVRLEGLDESIHFKYMVHKIHRGADLENGYVVYGFRGSVNDYSHVGFPGDLRDCEACHLEDTYGLPLPEGVTDLQPEHLHHRDAADDGDLPVLP